MGQQFVTETVLNTCDLMRDNDLLTALTVPSLFRANLMVHVLMKVRSAYIRFTIAAIYNPGVNWIFSVY